MFWSGCRCRLRASFSLTFSNLMKPPNGWKSQMLRRNVADCHASAPQLANAGHVSTLYLKIAIFQPKLQEHAPRTTFVLKSCDLGVLRVLRLQLKVAIFQPELREHAPRATSVLKSYDSSRSCRSTLRAAFVLKSCDFQAGAAADQGGIEPATAGLRKQARKRRARDPLQIRAVEVQKLWTFYDFCGARATLCGDRARRSALAVAPCGCLAAEIVKSPSRTLLTCPRAPLLTAPSFTEKLLVEALDETPAAQPLPAHFLPPRTWRTCATMLVLPRLRGTPCPCLQPFCGTVRTSPSAGHPRMSPSAAVCCHKRAARGGTEHRHLGGRWPETNVMMQQPCVAKALVQKPTYPMTWPLAISRLRKVRYLKSWIFKVLEAQNSDEVQNSDFQGFGGRKLKLSRFLKLRLSRFIQGFGSPKLRLSRFWRKT